MAEEKYLSYLGTKSYFKKWSSLKPVLETYNDLFLKGMIKKA